MDPRRLDELKKAIHAADVAVGTAKADVDLARKAGREVKAREREILMLEDRVAKLRKAYIGG